MASCSISTAARSQQWPLAVQLFQEIQLAEVRSTVVSYTSTIAAARWLQAVQCFTKWRRLVRPNVVTFTATLGACRCNWQLAGSIFQAMRDAEIRVNVIAFNTATGIKAMVRQTPRVSAVPLPSPKLRALRWRSSMPCHGGRREQGLGGTGGGKSDGEIGGEAMVQPDLICFTSAISSCEKGGQWQRALSLLDDLQFLQLQLDVVCFSAIISACQKAGEWQQALSVLAAMWVARVRANLVTFNAAISSCEQHGMWHQAAALMALMLSAAIQPDVISFNAIISCYEKEQRWRQTLAMLDALLGAMLQPTTITFNTAMTCCEKACQWQHALALFAMADRCDVISFNAAISFWFLRDGSAVAARLVPLGIHGFCQRPTHSSELRRSHRMRRESQPGYRAATVSFEKHDDGGTLKT
eukprot:Skav206858  [mRNA]  locus=scaffold1667:277459:282949:- [translate_table: standard]